VSRAEDGPTGDAPTGDAPTRDQLLAMAYADGELADDARAAFEARLGQEPALAREVAALKRLEVLARRAAPPEPIDFAWRALEGDLAYAQGKRLGTFLLGLAVVLGFAGGLAALLVAPLPLWVEACALLVLVGLALLFLSALRGRLKTLPYDPYTDVQR